MGKVKRKLPKPPLRPNNPNAGRKLFDGKDEQVVLAKLEQAFAYGASDSEACGYADISVDALYRYERAHPEIRKRKAMLKDKPLLAAREAWISSFKTRPELAARYVEGKTNEFKQKQQLEVEDVTLTEGLNKRIGKYVKPEAKV